MREPPERESPFLLFALMRAEASLSISGTSGEASSTVAMRSSPTGPVQSAKGARKRARLGMPTAIVAKKVGVLWSGHCQKHHLKSMVGILQYTQKQSGQCEQGRNACKTSMSRNAAKCTSNFLGSLRPDFQLEVHRDTTATTIWHHTSHHTPHTPEHCKRKFSDPHQSIYCESTATF
jgi:hypothetical protein